MRIDYSEPRQSYTSSPGPSRQRPTNGASSARWVTWGILATLLFGSGFGIGWYFSQQSAKKAFRAAMEQQSLESTPQSSSQMQQPPTVASQGKASATALTNPSVPPQTQRQNRQTATGPNGQPLSFFENLPKGQKDTVLGSGINEKSRAPSPTASPAAQPDAQTPPPKKMEAAPTARPAAQAAGYLVQVASYSTRKDADILRARLVVRGYAATVTETNINDKTWYRVRIGRHLEKEAASQIANQLAMGAKVIPDQD